MSARGVRWCVARRRATPGHAALTGGERTPLQEPDDLVLLFCVVRVEGAARVLREYEIKQIDELLLLQVGQRLEDDLSNTLLRGCSRGRRLLLRRSRKGA